MTPERLAELELDFASGAKDWPLEEGEGAELCRLARLGMTMSNRISKVAMYHEDLRATIVQLPSAWTGRRVVVAVSADG